MSTKAVVCCNDSGEFRARWQAFDGGPDVLGRAILAYAHSHGLRAMLESFFSSPSGWRSWPDSPALEADAIEVTSSSAALLTACEFVYVVSLSDNAIELHVPTFQGMGAAVDTISCPNGQPSRRQFMVKKQKSPTSKLKKEIRAAKTLEALRDAFSANASTFYEYGLGLVVMPAQFQIPNDVIRRLPEDVGRYLVARDGNRALLVEFLPSGYRYYLGDWPGEAGPSGAARADG